MIRPNYKGFRAATLIECLAVVAIIGGLIAAVGSSFVLTLRSYSGQYEAEALELEGQRAALEIDHYVSRALQVQLSDVGPFPSSPANLQGGTLLLLQPDGSSVVFSFEVDDSRSTSSLYVGSLSVAVRGVVYTYSTNVQFVPESGSNRPFWISGNGGVGYRWQLPSPNGTVRMGGISTIGS